MQFGVKFIHVLWAAFLPLYLHWSFIVNQMSSKHQNQHQSLFVFTIKVSHIFIGETDCTKFLALAVLRFAQMGWCNWPLKGVNHIPSRQGCVLSLVHLKHRSLASTEKMKKTGSIYHTPKTTNTELFELNRVSHYYLDNEVKDELHFSYKISLLKGNLTLLDEFFHFLKYRWPFGICSLGIYGFTALDICWV